MSNLRYYRKVIRITAEDSPNVRLARAEIAAGRKPSNKVLVPGVITWEEYQHRRKTYDKIRQTIGLDARFYKGPEVMLFPEDWLKHGAELADRLLRAQQIRRARGIGIDPAEGGDRTAMAAVDEYGLIELTSRQTPNTADVTGEAIAFMLKHGVAIDRVCFDRGGGGKQHADRLRAQGYKGIRTVAFGESLVLEPQAGRRPIAARKEVIEEHYQFENRRAQMFGELRMILDPEGIYRPDLFKESITSYGDTRGVKLCVEFDGFAIPRKYRNLHEELAPIPLRYNGEGRLILPPKHAPKGDDEDTDVVTLVKLIGHSPDEADALALAVHAMLHKSPRRVARAIV